MENLIYSKRVALKCCGTGAGAARSTAGVAKRYGSSFIITVLC
jgi:hypothetical protein